MGVSLSDIRDEGCKVPRIVCYKVNRRVRVGRGGIPIH